MSDDQYAMGLTLVGVLAGQLLGWWALLWWAVLAFLLLKGIPWIVLRNR